MLEYGQGEHRYLENPAGSFVPNMVRWWDDLFALCEQVGLHLLLTPFDTFFLWRRWRHHPYRAANGGPCASRRRFLRCPATRAAIKARLAFATRRWGASPALFGWDLWNELKPQWAEGDCARLDEFVADTGGFLRALETRLHGRAHPQTASVFVPDLAAHPALARIAYAHAALDFASPHCYDAAIDAPRGSVAPALAMGRLVAAAIAATPDGRPVADSEHGPIRLHARRRMLPEALDDEMFRRMQWAHLASGGAGGGMRWPYRHPHRLTPGMHAAQRALARLPAAGRLDALRRAPQPVGRAGGEPARPRRRRARLRQRRAGGGVAAARGPRRGPAGRRGRGGAAGGRRRPGKLPGRPGRPAPSRLARRRAGAASRRDAVSFDAARPGRRQRTASPPTTRSPAAPWRHGRSRTTAAGLPHRPARAGGRAGARGRPGGRRPARAAGSVAVVVARRGGRPVPTPPPASLRRVAAARPPTSWGRPDAPGRRPSPHARGRAGAAAAVRPIAPRPARRAARATCRPSAVAPPRPPPPACAASARTRASRHLFDAAAAGDGPGAGASAPDVHNAALCRTRIPVSAGWPCRRSPRPDREAAPRPTPTDTA